MNKTEREKAWEVRKKEHAFRIERHELVRKATKEFDERSRKELLEFCIAQGGHFWEEPKWNPMAFGRELAKECAGCGKSVQLEFVNFDGETVYRLEDEQKSLQEKMNND